MATLGDTDLHNDWYYVATNYAYALQVTATENGRVSSLTAYFSWSTGYTHLKIKPIIWDNNRNLLYNGGETDYGVYGPASGNSWLKANFNKNYALVKDTTYWIGFVSNFTSESPAVMSFCYEADSNNTIRAQNNNNYAAPQNLAGNEDASASMCVYITYK
jgi:hypothetical protein